MVGILRIFYKTTIICGIGFLAASWMLPSPASADSISDPTRPDFGNTRSRGSASSTQPDKPSWDLSCIIYSTSRRLAVVNGQILHVGDSVKGGKVLDINPDSVVLSYRGKRRVLQLVSGMQGKNRIDKPQGENSK
ncbi:MAG: general secretion pathway protein GspB [Thermodesulfobacteriota bacterium]